jgi:pyruvate/2-oxoglutarate/acetoin dehydrogenase E1 component
MTYFDELKEAMEFLGRDERTVFLGQAVAVAGTAMSKTLVGVDRDKVIEFPVAEEMQMGVTVGLALSGRIPVSIYPRWNFLLLAFNQLINHLDKARYLIGDEVSFNAIIRTGIGSERPLHPQHQHVGDFTKAVRQMCSTIDVIRLEEPEDIMPGYRKALERNDGRATLLVEYGDYYNEK